MSLNFPAAGSKHCKLTVALDAEKKLHGLAAILANIAVVVVVGLDIQCAGTVVVAAVADLCNQSKQTAVAVAVAAASDSSWRLFTTTCAHRQ